MPSPYPIPSSFPDLPIYVGPPNVIRASVMAALVERDRFIYAVNRRCLLSGGGAQTNSASSRLAYLVSVRTSLSFNGSVFITAAGDDVEVKIDEFYYSNTASLFLSGSAPVVMSTSITGLPTGSQALAFGVSISNVGGHGILNHIRIVEANLGSSDLP